VLVAAFKRGKTPEAIHQGYETISLADAYAIFTYYLRHRDEVDAYLAEQDQQGAEVRERVEAIWPPEEGFREKLVARLES
jgi:hypothetical protein